MSRILPTSATDYGAARPVSDEDSGRFGVVDIGSNSIRLVVYEGAPRAPMPIFNEKVLCGIGAGLGKSGRLNAEGVAMALENLPRFVSVADAMNVAELHVVATSAVRDAQDGPAFAQEVEARCGVSVRVISGEEEAHLSGMGVLSGHPGAEGIAGDLGGGSLELIRLHRARVLDSVTLPLGPLRLQAISGEHETLVREIDAALDTVPWLIEGRGKAFFAVGGAWRALARAHLAQTRHKLRVIDGYTINAADFSEFARLISRQHPANLAPLPDVPSRRIETLPVAGLLLRRLLKRMRPRDLVFSATGLREGVLYDALAPERRGEDPLIAAASHYGRRFGRFGDIGDALYAWTAPLFPREDEWTARLRHAAALMADVGWAEHPDYRAKHVFRRLVSLPLSGLDHVGRAFVARALYARYSGDSRWADKRARALGLETEQLRPAKILGAGLRLGITLSAGQRGVLTASELRLGQDRLTLIVPSWGALAKGDAVRSRLQDLAAALDLAPNLVVPSAAAKAD